MAIAKIIRNDGNEAPRVQTIIPGVFATPVSEQGTHVDGQGSPDKKLGSSNGIKNSSFVIRSTVAWL